MRSTYNNIKYNLMTFFNSFDSSHFWLLQRNNCFTAVRLSLCKHHLCVHTKRPSFTKFTISSHLHLCWWNAYSFKYLATNRVQYFWLCLAQFCMFKIHRIQLILPDKFDAEDFWCKKAGATKHRFYILYFTSFTLIIISSWARFTKYIS